MTSPARKLVIGCGYLGIRVARRWLAAGDEVSALTRTAARAAELERQGLRPLVGDVVDARRLPQFAAFDTVLFAVGFDRSDSATIDEVYAGGVRNVLATLPAEIGRLIYVSTTGVYGDARGDEVDELTPPDPQRPGGIASLAAERAIADHPLGGRAAVLRLAGIYGPGRIPYLASLQAGEPIPAPSAGWLNLIHVDDGATAVLAAERWLEVAGRGPHTFCVSDGSPVVRGDYYAEAARLLGAVKPRFADPAPDSPALARAGADRRISNRKMLASLGVKLAYPDYRAGLAAIMGSVENQSR